MPKSLSSPIFPPPMGARRPGKEKRNLFLRWDFLTMSLPWCLITIFEGERGELGLAGVSESMLLEKARLLSLFRSVVSGFASSPPSPSFFFFNEAGPAIDACGSFSYSEFVLGLGRRREPANFPCYAIMRSVAYVWREFVLILGQLYS